MAVGIKPMQRIRSMYGEQTKLFLSKSIIFSDIQYNFLLLTACTTSVTDTLGQQISWARKNCFYRKKSDSSVYQMLPVRPMLHIKPACFFWKRQPRKLLAFNRGLEIPTNKVKGNTPTKQLFLNFFAVQF